jgi:hypothetical protein
MMILPLPPNNSRLGFNYFPDTLHYRETDLQTWLPELKALGASWLVLETPSDRAIPEAFILGLVANGVEPVLHFRMRVDLPPTLNEMKLLFQTYARWGVHYVVLFDRPNSRESWSSTAWVQNNLVERFLDCFLPLAEAAVQAGLIPVFPPLEPGGDYWDTAFLRAALQGIQRRGSAGLFPKLVLGAYAWTSGRSLNWGAGGPERWPGARPYFTPSNSEDQLGFRIFDWYLTIARAALSVETKVLIIAGGARLDEPTQLPKAENESQHAELNLKIASLMTGITPTGVLDEVQKAALDPVPDDVLACSFWLLSAAADSPFVPQAWFKPGGETLPAAGAFRQWFSNRQLTGWMPADRTAPTVVPLPKTTIKSSCQGSGKPISHYLLLPLYEWGISDWHLEVIKPFIKKHLPTIGFSIEEAKHASKVTVVGGPSSFPPSVLEELILAGCSIQQIGGDGTRIATQLEAL